MGGFFSNPFKSISQTVSHVGEQVTHAVTAPTRQLEHLGETLGEKVDKVGEFLGNNSKGALTLAAGAAGGPGAGAAVWNMLSEEERQKQLAASGGAAAVIDSGGSSVGGVGLLGNGVLWGWPIQYWIILGLVGLGAMSYLKKGKK